MTMPATAADVLGLDPSGPMPRIVSRYGCSSGITVLIPTHTGPDGDRTASLQTCVQSLRSAIPPGDSMALLVVDNGLSPQSARDVGQLLSESGLPHQIAAAAPDRDPRSHTAARARNVGLDALARLPVSSPLRNRDLLFLDDDNAIGPGALIELTAALRDAPNAIAVCPRIEAVTDLAEWLANAPTGARANPRRLPGPLDRGRYDLLSITSHGSCIAGRVVGLLVRQDPLLAWIRQGGRLFFDGTPYGTSEDMLAMASLSCFGELWHVPSAMVADQARDSPAATRRQQLAWGYDHAWLAKALAEADLLEPGVHALSWDDGAGWRQSTVHVPGVTGFIVNPGELRVTGGILRALAADEPTVIAMFGASAPVIASGATRLSRILSWWQRESASAPRITRCDLPPLVRRDWATLHDGLDAAVGHLAGNILGTHAIDPAATRLPRFFLFGARQRAVRPASMRQERGALSA